MEETCKNMRETKRDNSARKTGGSKTKYRTQSKQQTLEHETLKRGSSQVYFADDVLVSVLQKEHRK